MSDRDARGRFVKGYKSNKIRHLREYTCGVCKKRFLAYRKNAKYCSCKCFGVILTGRKLSDKTKKKISINNSSHRVECREKISDALKGKKLLKETIEKIKKARAKQILPVKDTKIEIKIQNFLKQLRIEYFTHQYMKIEHGYQCDILIPSMNLVIECDGDYWHKYPIGLDKDHIRTKELLEKGFKVLRLWECEIKELDLHSFKNKLEEKTICQN